MQLAWCAGWSLPRVELLNLMNNYAAGVAASRIDFWPVISWDVTIMWQLLYGEMDALGADYWKQTDAF